MGNRNYFEDVDFELEDLKYQVFSDNRRRSELNAFPDCRDPAHPGCADCEEIDNDD